jgi:hypothetical protein
MQEPRQYQQYPLDGADRPALGFFHGLCAVCAVLTALTLRYAPQIDAAGAREQECVVFTTRLDVARRSMFVTCTPPAPAPVAKAAR